MSQTEKDRLGDIKLFYQKKGNELFSKLSITEKEFAYHMVNASLCGYHVSLYQSSEHMQSILHKIYNLLRSHFDFDEKFLKQLRIYWTFLFTNNGVHFTRKYKDNKRTPDMLNLDQITEENFAKYGVKFSEAESKYLFDPIYQPTSTVNDNIEASGNNYYSKDMTTELFNNLPAERKAILNAYHSLDEDGTVKTELYSAKPDGKCSRYLQNCLRHIKHAYGVALSDEAGEYFDEGCKKSLEYLIKFLESGEEADFKEHSKWWTKMKCRVEYNFGFIEQYDDPMGNIGHFQADVTIKSTDIGKLLELLPSFESRFPFPEEWKRKDMSILPNASEVYKLIGIGGNGPDFSTVAYCLPNYEDLRSEYGSKQIMYSLDGLKGDVNLKMQLLFDNEEREFLLHYSNDLGIFDKLYSCSVILHETIGHGSGNLHKYVDADGNEHELKREMLQERLGKWTRGLEEMRAEILALYTNITFYDELAAIGYYGDYPKYVNKDKMIELIIKEMVEAGPARWKSMPDDSTEVIGAHPQANTGIMYYLLDNSGGIEMMEVPINHAGNNFVNFKFKITDQAAVIKCIGELAHTVQRFTSTAPIEEVNEFMEKYAVSTRNSNYSRYIKDLSNFMKKGVKQNLQIFDELTMTKGKNNENFIISKHHNPMNYNTFGTVFKFYQRILQAHDL